MEIPTKVFKLGKKPPRIDPRTFKLKEYIKPMARPLPGAEASWVTHVTNWPMYLNDQIGDCVIAAMAHCVEQWEIYANPGGLPPGVARPTDRQVLQAYEAVGGYNPDDPSTDNGCTMLDALKYWRRTGIGGHKITAFMAVDPKNLVEVETAIWLFGNVYVGMQLPLSAQGQDRWTVPDGGIYGDQGAQGGWGGHAVMCPAMSPKTVTCVTWGEALKMSRNFFIDYCEEAYAVLSQDWFEKTNGLSVSGFDMATLFDDLGAL